MHCSTSPDVATILIRFYRFIKRIRSFIILYEALFPIRFSHALGSLDFKRRQLYSLHRSLAAAAATCKWREADFWFMKQQIRSGNSLFAFTREMNEHHEWGKENLFIFLLAFSLTRVYKFFMLLFRMWVWSSYWWIYVGSVRRGQSPMF